MNKLFDEYESFEEFCKRMDEQSEWKLDFLILEIVLFSLYVVNFVNIFIQLKISLFLLPPSYMAVYLIIEIIKLFIRYGRNI